MSRSLFFFFFFFNDTATTEIYTLSLHDALPISSSIVRPGPTPASPDCRDRSLDSCTCRSEEHTSELQSRPHLVCRLLLEKKKKKSTIRTPAAPSHHALSATDRSSPDLSIVLSHP